MKNAELMIPTQRGTWVYYEPNPNPSDCMRDLFILIKNHFKNKFPEDLQRLQQRLSMRENDLCVIGFALKGKQANTGNDKPCKKKGGVNQE